MPAGRLSWSLALIALAIVAGTARAQEVPEAPSPIEEKIPILTDPESLKKKANSKDRMRPPLEYFRSNVAPFDILPFIKANHWSTLGLELRANHDDYAGTLQTQPVDLLAMPMEVVYRRDARLVKGQQSRLSLQIMLPRIPGELGFEIVRPDSIRPDEIWSARMRTLEPHQMLVLILSKKSSDDYAHWGKYQALYPFGLDRLAVDNQALDRSRYYRLAVPLDPEKPVLSSHPLTWTTISHVVWDGFSPEILNNGQQQAMLDWLHWGGQLIITGGAETTLGMLRDSFLSPYLPAEPTGENILLGEAELTPMSKAYPPINVYSRDEIELDPTSTDEQAVERYGRYKPPAPLQPPKKRPVFFAGLKPNEGAVGIPVGDAKGTWIGVEQRVGRGRVLLLAVNPNDPALVAWPGHETFIRRVVLRRPEETVRIKGHWTRTSLPYEPPVYWPLAGSELSWMRFLSRDLGATEKRPEPYQKSVVVNKAAQVRVAYPGMIPNSTRSEEVVNSTQPVAEWIDSSAVPALGRRLLEEASGISVPSASFVLKVIVWYILALVPLNWLICRYVIGRREWAWVAVPFLALGFAIGVERAAAYDLGFDLACDEIDVIETFGEYPRAHVSRFGSLYATGRVKFNVSYPNDPTALVLPMSTGHALRGEEIATAVFQSYPIPALVGYQVQPRSMGLFRAEQMLSMRGSIRLESDEKGRRIVNESDLELRDAVVVDSSGPDEADRREIHLGTIAPGGVVELKEVESKEEPIAAGSIDPRPMLELLRGPLDARPENQGEIRLVAWTTKPVGGQVLEPVVDRHRGFTAVVAHLRLGPPPSPDGPTYNALARGDVREYVPLAETPVEPEPAQSAIMMPGIGGGGRRRASANPLPPPMLSPKSLRVP